LDFSHFLLGPLHPHDLSLRCAFMAASASAMPTRSRRRPWRKGLLSP